MANEKNTQVALTNLQVVATKLHQNIFPVLADDGKEGFEKAFLVANAIDQLKQILVPEYMAPIMSLQGNKLGFKTDRDTKGGYDEATVKNCLIEAVLTGVQPVGNHFNIISSNCYLTKEGFGYLLKKMPDLWYKITPGLPRINNDKTGAAITMNIQWKFKNTDTSISEERLEVAVKTDAYTSVDGIIGKATRKARAWLFNTLTGSEIADGDITDMQDAKRHATASEIIGTRSDKLTKEAEEAIKNAGAKKV